MAPSPALTLPPFQTLGQFYSLSEPQSLHLENGNDGVPTSQVVGQSKPKYITCDGDRSQPWPLLLDGSVIGHPPERLPGEGLARYNPADPGITAQG